MLHPDRSALTLQHAAPGHMSLLAYPLLAMAVFWTIIPTLVHTAPPLDVVESAMWGREWVIGTYKHPGMPSWLLEAGRWLDGGRIGWPAYATGQLFNLATLGLTFAFARDLAGSRVALATVLALLGVEYFSWRSVEFNHTQAQMPFWVGAAWCAWHAVKRGTLRWWLGLGAMAALGLYAKLSNAMELIVIAGWVLSMPRGRARLSTRGPWLGALLFLVMATPAARWLVNTNFQALNYASARGQEQSLLATLLFPANALLQAAPIVLALGVAGVFARGAVAPPAPQPRTPDADWYLVVISVVPPVMLIGSALAGGSGVRATWLAPALPLLTVLLLQRLETRLSDAVLTRLAAVALGVAVLVPLGYAVAVPNLARFSDAPPLRVRWPQQEIARALAAAWTAETGKPLEVVAGSSWSAGLVGLNHPDRPSILTEGQLAFSPWIVERKRIGKGALVVWTEGRGAIAMPALEKLVAGHPVKELRVPVPRGKPGQEVVLKYAILPPG